MIILREIICNDRQNAEDGDADVRLAAFSNIGSFRLQLIFISRFSQILRNIESDCLKMKVIV